MDPETFGFPDWIPGVFTEGFRNWVGLFVFLALAAFLYWDARKAKADA